MPSSDLSEQLLIRALAQRDLGSLVGCENLVSKTIRVEEREEYSDFYRNKGRGYVPHLHCRLMVTIQFSAYNRVNFDVWVHRVQIFGVRTSPWLLLRSVLVIDSCSLGIANTHLV